jgi:hypothetical protein
MGGFFDQTSMAVQPIAGLSEQIASSKTTKN